MKKIMSMIMMTMAIDFFIDDDDSVPCRSNQSHRENKRFEAKMEALAAEKGEHFVSPLPAASERGQSGNCRVSPSLDKN